MMDDELLHSRTAGPQEPVDIQTHCDDELMWVVATSPLEPEAAKDQEPLQREVSMSPVESIGEEASSHPSSPDAASEGDLVNLEELKHQILATFPPAPAPALSRAKGPSSRSQRGKAQPTVRPKPVSRPTSAHERSYQRSTCAHQRQVKSREEEKSAKDKAKIQLADDGPAAAACKRLHEQTQRKAEEMSRIRDKYDKEFASMAPFSPSTSDRGESRRREFQAWMKDQEAWRAKRDEKRAQRVKGRAEEEDNYAKQHSVHRDLSRDVSKAVDRLYASHKKSQEKIEKLRSEKIRQEMQHLEQASVHRNVTKMPGASDKVQGSVHRLYHQDLMKGQKWLQEQANAKMRDQELEERDRMDAPCKQKFEGQASAQLREDLARASHQDQWRPEGSAEFHPVASGGCPTACLETELLPPHRKASEADGGQPDITFNAQHQRRVQAAVMIQNMQRSRHARTPGCRAQSWAVKLEQVDAEHTRTELRLLLSQQAELDSEKPDVPSDGPRPSSEDEQSCDRQRAKKAEQFPSDPGDARTQSENELQHPSETELSEEDRQVVSSGHDARSEPEDEEVFASGLDEENADSGTGLCHQTVPSDGWQEDVTDDGKTVASEVNEDDGQSVSQAQPDSQFHPDPEPSVPCKERGTAKTESEDDRSFASESSENERESVWQADPETHQMNSLSMRQDDARTESEDEGLSSSELDKQDAAVLDACATSENEGPFPTELGEGAGDSYMQDELFENARTGSEDERPSASEISESDPERHRCGKQDGPTDHSRTESENGTSASERDEENGGRHTQLELRGHGSGIGSRTGSDRGSDVDGYDGETHMRTKSSTELHHTTRFSREKRRGLANVSKGNLKVEGLLASSSLQSSEGDVQHLTRFSRKK